MKGLKKLNLGLILTIIVVVGVIIYCVRTESSRKSAKNEINTVCNDFLEITDKYATLPEEMQVIGIKKSDINLDDISSKTENELKEKMISEDAAEIQNLILEQLLKDQLVDTSKVVTSFDRKISKIKSYEFDGNQVTVTFDSKISLKKKYKEQGNDSEKISEESFDVQGETITLEKKDGNWKVVYANLTYTNPQTAITF